MEITSKAEAILRGESLYFTGKVCKRGHIDQRRVSNKNCLSCEREKNKERYDNDPQAAREKSAAWRAKNPEKVKQQSARAVKKMQEDEEHRLSVRAHNRERYASDPEYRARCNEHSRVYREKNREELNEKARLRWSENGEYMREMERARYQRDRDKILARNRFWREENIDFVQAYKSRWHLSNPEKAKASRWRRKARLRDAGGCFTGDDISRLYSYQRSMCATCRKSISDGYEIDHIMPLALGGSNWIENIQLLCPACNRKKSCKHPIDWANENGMLL